MVSFWADSEPVPAHLERVDITDEFFIVIPRDMTPALREELVERVRPIAVEASARARAGGAA